MPHKIPYNSILQSRDIAVLRCLFDCRVATTLHLSRLYFKGSSEAAKMRVQNLKRSKFIIERSRRAYEPAIHSLTAKGLKILTDQGALVAYSKTPVGSLSKRAQVSESTVRHELEVMDVRVAFHVALQKDTGVELKNSPPGLCSLNSWRGNQVFLTGQSW